MAWLLMQSCSEGILVFCLTFANHYDYFGFSHAILKRRLQPTQPGKQGPAQSLLVNLARDLPPPILLCSVSLFVISWLFKIDEVVFPCPAVIGSVI